MEEDRATTTRARPESGPVTVRVHEAESVHEAVHVQAQRTPDAVAVTDGHASLTYRELDARASGLARILRERGIGKEDIVGVAVDRSPAAFLAILGILKAGAAYLPLDPAYPRERRAFMVEDASPRLLIADARNAGDARGFGVNVLVIEELDLDGDADAGARVDPSDLAYLMYTSGSTGKPKGVLIEHDGVLHRARAQARAIPVGPGDRVLQYASLNFDVSVFEFTVALPVGATLVVAPARERLTGEALTRFVHENRVTAGLIPPSVLATLPYASLPHLRVMMAGGEACQQALVDRWGQGRVFLNFYGPTEITVWASHASCTPGEPVTIGQPPDGVEALIVDEDLKPVPVGEVGELLIGGAGVARGYLNRPDLTRERFIPHPLKPGSGARVYRTGDLARWTRDGRIECLGRRDRQVKVRGVRVEPAEVEDTLSQHPRVAGVIVNPDRDARGDARLVAYVVLHGDAPPDAPRRVPDGTVRQLRGFLEERVVPAMIPSAFVELPELPLTPNKKADYAALPALDDVPAAPASPGAVTPPRTRVERVIGDAWARVLDRGDVGVHENFFDVGGHSLLVAEVQAHLQRELARKIPIVSFFEHPTIAGLAKHLDDADAGAPRVERERERGASRRAARERRRGRARSTRSGRE